MRCKRRWHLRIVIVGGHPDDAEYKAGDTAVKWAGRSSREARFGTNGDLSDRPGTKKVVAARRAACGSKTERRLRKSVNFHDGELVPSLEAGRRSSASFANERADIVIDSHRPSDYYNLAFLESSTDSTSRTDSFSQHTASPSTPTIRHLLRKVPIQPKAFSLLYPAIRLRCGCDRFLQELSSIRIRRAPPRTRLAKSRLDLCRTLFHPSSIDLSLYSSICCRNSIRFRRAELAATVVFFRLRVFL